MTTATTIAAFDRVHSSWQELILASVRQWRRPLSVPYLAPLLTGETVAVWDNLNRCRGCDNQAVTHLLPALLRHANRLEREGLEVSAADCRWLAHQLQDESLTLIGAHHLNN